MNVFWKRCYCALLSKLTLHSMNDRNGMCSLKQIDCPGNVWLPDQMSGGIAIAS